MAESLIFEGSRQRYLECAIRVGDRLLSRSLRDKFGTYWLTYDSFSKSQSFSRGLYSGSAGIGFFLLQLFRLSREQRFLEAAKAVASKLISDHTEKEERASQAFFTGELGVAYFLLRLGQETGESVYTEWAVATARGCAGFLRADTTPDDLLNGRAGALLGLLKIYAETADPEILSLMKLGIEELLKRVHLSDKGIYWDRNWRNIRGLCGLSHGASGLALAFMEIGHFFSDQRLLSLARLCFDYEDALFDKERGNWPDFRVPYFDDRKAEAFEALEQGRLEEYRKPSDMSAWCHGAVGIGLARQRAREIMPDQRWDDSLRAALAKVMSTEGQRSVEQKYRSAGFCHGEEGGAELLLEAGIALEDSTAIAAALKTAERAIEWFDRKGHYGCSYFMDDIHDDPALFMGEAGAGLYFLRLSSPEVCESLVLPRVAKLTDRTYAKLDAPLSKEKPLHYYFLADTFPRSLELFSHFEAARLQQFLAAQEYQRPEHLPDNFVSFFNAALPGIDDKYRPYFEDAGALEWEALQLETKGQSFFDDAIREVYTEEVIKPLIERTPEEDFLKWTVRTSEAVSVLCARWPWHDSEKDLTEILKLPEAQIPLLIRRGSKLHGQIPAYVYNMLISAAEPVVLRALKALTLEELGVVEEASQAPEAMALNKAIQASVIAALLVPAPLSFFT